MYNSGTDHRMFLVFVYAILFIYSLYSIFQIRYGVQDQEIPEEKATFVFFMSLSPRITFEHFILIKLSLFVVIACISFVLMQSNYFVYKRPDLEKELTKETHTEIKKELLKQKKALLERKKSS